MKTKRAESALKAVKTLSRDELELYAVISATTLAMVLEHISDTKTSPLPSVGVSGLTQNQVDTALRASSSVRNRVAVLDSLRN